MTTAHSGRALMAEVLMLRHGSWFAAYYTRYVRRPTFRGRQDSTSPESGDGLSPSQW
jgi:hypothetical protein